jgi:DNA mismatch repair ATPase MutS
MLKLHLTARSKEPICGVPDKAFSEWALKIVNSGKHVCKVEQMETAVDQQNEKNRERVIKHVHQLESVSLTVQLRRSSLALSTRAILQICRSGLSQWRLCLIAITFIQSFWK